MKSKLNNFAHSINTGSKNSLSESFDDSSSNPISLPFKSFMQSQNSVESKHVRIRQPYKGRYPPEFLANLPEGVTYNDPEKQLNKLSEKGLSIFNDNDGDVVVVADFTINIEKITKQQLISMRKFLPSEEYRLIKNRKSARLCRKKRKEERGDMQT